MRYLLIRHIASCQCRCISHLKLVLLGLIFVMPIARLHAQESDIVAQGQIVKIGMSTALSGPAADLGINVRQGVEVALKQASEKSNRQFELVALDDRYEPARTIPNMRELINDKQVTAIIGNVGTPTSVVALPIAKQQNVCFFGAYTGAGVLRRTPPDRQVFNYRASYAQETAAMVHGLVQQGGMAPTNIAIFTQRDSYGDAGYSGAMDALRSEGLTETDRVIHERYDRNSLCVEDAVSRILLADHVPKAIIMVGAYAPCAKFIRLVRESGINPVFLNVSFVGTEPLIKALGAFGEGVIITQVVPHPMADLPVVNAYRKAMLQYAPDASLNFGSLEGYIATVIFSHALDRIEGSVTRENIIVALGQLGTFDIGLDEQMSFSQMDHQASDRVWPTVIRQQKALPLDWSQLRDRVEPVRLGGAGE